MPQPSKFHYFGELPVEIQHMIVALALTDLQTGITRLTLTTPKWNVVEETTASGTHRLDIRSSMVMIPRLPPFFHVNKQMRREAFRLAWLEDRLIPLTISGRPDKYLLFNPSYDLLEIDDSALHFHRSQRDPAESAYPPETVQAVMASIGFTSALMNRVRFVQFASPDFCPCFDFGYDLLTSDYNLQSLETITITYNGLTGRWNWLEEDVERGSDWAGLSGEDTLSNGKQSGSFDVLEVVRGDAVYVFATDLIARGWVRDGKLVYVQVL